jgi:hypothetical protein
MIVVGMILLVWFGLAVLTVGTLNVWKAVVMWPSESLVNHRSAQSPTGAGVRSATSLVPQQVGPRRSRSGRPVSLLAARTHAELGSEQLSTQPADHLAAG